MSSRPPGDTRAPTGSGAGARPSPRRRWPSRRPRSGTSSRASTSSSRATSSATAANTSRAATRGRPASPRAAARPARRRAAAPRSRASAFAIAVATSSVKAAIRDSVSAGSGSSAFERGDHHAPQPPVDDDRRADRRADPDVPEPLGDAGRRRRRSCPSVRGGRSAHQRRDAGPSSSDPRADRLLDPGTAPDAHGGHRAVALEAADVGGVDAEELADLARDRREDLRRIDPARDERRHAPQRGLLVGEPAHLAPRLGVRDRGGHELGEVGEPRLGVRRERRSAFEDATTRPTDARRRRSGAHRRGDAQGAELVGDRADGIVVVVHPRGRPVCATSAETLVPSVPAACRAGCGRPSGSRRPRGDVPSGSSRPRRVASTPRSRRPPRRRRRTPPRRGPRARPASPRAAARPARRPAAARPRRARGVGRELADQDGDREVDEQVRQVPGARELLGVGRRELVPVVGEQGGHRRRHRVRDAPPPGDRDDGGDAGGAEDGGEQRPSRPPRARRRRARRTRRRRRRRARPRRPGGHAARAVMRSPPRG